jgi:diadenosine tetraphosphate (Ap4A) HIT family hydrolase
LTCPLCAPSHEHVLWRDDRCRVIDAGDAAYPGYSRVVWHAHVREMTDLAADERAHMMRVVYTVEAALRELLRPDKINLAAFGNQVPHLHWHVIPRFADDAHFPDPIWAARRRDGAARSFDRGLLARELERRMTASTP